MSDVLQLGDTGERVHDLQRQLRDAGYAVEVSGRFDEATEAALRAFQSSRGLRVDGLCGRESWTGLLEASKCLGDRLLYQTHPNLRGDDVGELQRRLNALGFDAGREDAIFGPATERALREFQRNAGIAVDGVLGPAARDALDRLGSLAAGSVATVRERETLQRERRTLRGYRVMVQVEGGLETLGDAVFRELHDAGAEALLLVAWDDTRAAALANQWSADLFLSIRAASEPAPRCAYFANQTFRSEAGYLLAWALDAALTPVLGPAAMPAGRTYAALRETRMAAVVCEPVRRGEVDSMRAVMLRLPQVARAIAQGVRTGVEKPAEVRPNA